MRWLYQGYRSTEWCPRWDVDVAARAVPGRRLPGENRPSIYVRFPLRERAGEELVDLDHHAVDPPGQCGGRGEVSPTRNTSCARMGVGWPEPGTRMSAR